MLELNLTAPHLAGWMMLVWIGGLLLRGSRLIRYVAWAGLWQLLTPTMHVMLDVPLFLVAWAGSEWLYAQATRRLDRHDAHP